MGFSATACSCEGLLGSPMSHRQAEGGVGPAHTTADGLLGLDLWASYGF